MSPQTAAETAQSLRARILAPVTAERERIEEGLREAKAEIEAEAAKHAMVMRCWQQKAEESRKAFRPEPPAPVARDMTGHEALLHRAVTARGECIAWEERLLGEHVTHVEAAYRQALPALLTRTRETPLGQIGQILPEWNDWLRLLAQARGAAGRAGGVMPHEQVTDRMRKTVTSVDLLDAVDGADLMAPEPFDVHFLDIPMRDGGQRNLDGPTGLTLAEASLESQARLNGGRRGPVF